MSLSEQIAFHPWVGDNYGETSRWGVPLLLVGESHYEDEGPTPQLTQQCVEAHIRGDRKEDYWTNILNTVGSSYESSMEEDRRAFWDSLAFYTYVQEMVGAGPDDHVTRAMWREAESPFMDVIRELEPGCILVFGRKLWRELPEPDSEGPVVRAGNVQTETSQYGDALAGRLEHPLWPGYSSKKWGALASSIIEEAGRDAGGT